ncbi:hypothetical protein F511_13113 [Dorcoceras hygrometricum]|uniref:Uncharacterized protein n=1 Tax=Dorcoceras hygrometricum TaxID=472368 RepID=A0A2Z7CXH5_9LAMI|nr:hypothetical protein F511_13113 [Dorcoceras hygrometricum]
MSLFALGCVLVIFPELILFRFEHIVVAGFSAYQIILFSFPAYVIAAYELSDILMLVLSAIAIPDLLVEPLGSLVFLSACDEN